MRSNYLPIDTAGDLKNPSLFQKGNRRAMDFISRRSFRSLLHIGKCLIDNGYLVSFILHECYLKAWGYCNRMQSLTHIYRLIRMNLRLQILRHIEKSHRTIYGQALLIDHFDKTIRDFEDHTEDINKCGQDILWLEMITESMKYIPPESGQGATGYFMQELSYRQIADRLGKSTRQIFSQINRSIEQIKSIVHASHQKNQSLSQARQVTGPTLLLALGQMFYNEQFFFQCPYISLFALKGWTKKIINLNLKRFSKSDNCIKLYILPSMFHFTDLTTLHANRFS
jgi:DNA-directed RNA polymerase specialized sigma24 family protein